MLTPLREAGGRIVFVNRGFIPAELKNRSRRMAGEPSGTVRVEGLLRLPPDGRPNWFLPDNRPDLNYWFWVDLPAMAAADKLDRVAPFYIDADAAPNPGGWPQGGVTRLASAQQPPAIRDHVVFPGGCDDRHLCPFSSPRRGAPMTAYQQLEARFRRLGALEEAIGVLHWDSATMMPPGGAATRAEQLATLSLFAHEQLTAAEIGDLLAEAEGESDALDAWQRANLREMRRRRGHAVAVPGDLVEAVARISSECETVWRKARPADDFAAVRPLLEQDAAPAARGRRGQGRASRRQALRGVARPLRAGRHGRDDRPPVRRDRRLLCPI